MFEFIKSFQPNLKENRATGLAMIPVDNVLFQDHFIDMPVLPASLCLEISAQIAGPLCELKFLEKFKFEKYAFLSMVRTMKVHTLVELPASLSIFATLQRLEPSYAVCSVTAKEENHNVLNARIVFALHEMLDSWKPSIEQRNKRLHKWMS